jgi:Protein of unknown function (DUF2802)
MMISILITLTGFACMLVFYQSYALHFARRKCITQEENEQELQHRIQSLEQELGALCSASMGAGEHVVKLEQQVQRITERQDQLELRASGDRTYDQASQLVNKGADTEDLMESCGLTRGEAELLVMMRRGAA